MCKEVGAAGYAVADFVKGFKGNWIGTYFDFFGASGAGAGGAWGPSSSEKMYPPIFHFNMVIQGLAC